MKYWHYPMQKTLLWTSWIVTRRWRIWFRLEKVPCERWQLVITYQMGAGRKSFPFCSKHWKRTMLNYKKRHSNACKTFCKDAPLIRRPWVALLIKNIFFTSKIWFQTEHFAWFVSSSVDYFEISCLNIWRISEFLYNNINYLKNSQSCILIFK